MQTQAFRWLEKCNALQSYYVHAVTFCREGNDTPFHFSCLENPIDGGAL